MRNAVTPEVLELVIRGDYKDPFTVLGMHSEKGKLIVRALLPQAVSVAVVDSSTGKKISPMQRWGVTALFVAEIAGKKELFPYRLEIDWGDHVQVMEDPYRFPPVLGDIDVWLLSEGTHHRPYEKLGAHPIGMEGVQGVSFAVWAPNALRVSVVGDFNNWDGR